MNAATGNGIIVGSLTSTSRVKATKARRRATPPIWEESPAALDSVAWGSRPLLHSLPDYLVSVAGFSARPILRAGQIGPVTETTYVNCVLSNQNTSFSGCVNYCTPAPRHCTFEGR